MLATVVTVLLVVGLCLIPRRVPSSKLEVPIAVVGLLGAFVLGTWLLGGAANVVGTAVESWNLHGWSAFLLVISPLALPLAVGLARWTDRRRPVAAAAPEPASKYEDDEGWYAADWRRDQSNADHDLGHEGYRLDLVDGPLAGKTARLRDSRFRLWVARARSGEIVVRGAIHEPISHGVVPLGSYGFAHEAEAMLWQAAPVPAANS